MGLLKLLYFCVAVITVVVVTSQIEMVDTQEQDGEEIRLPMCQNFLPYNRTKLPNRFGHVTQVVVYRHIQQYWNYMDCGCSSNFRQFVCSLYLPKYDPQTQTVAGPCKEMCGKAKRKCKKAMLEARSRWPRQLWCNRLPSERANSTCLRPVRESKTKLTRKHCVANNIPMCQHLNTSGSFRQRSLEEITTELRFYEPLLLQNCHQYLQFFLCGTYLPFCAPQRAQFALPCRELCEEVKNDCESYFNFVYSGLSWPSKLQCHRYTSSEDLERDCANPGDI